MAKFSVSAPMLENNKSQSIRSASTLRILCHVPRSNLRDIQKSCGSIKWI